MYKKFKIIREEIQKQIQKNQSADGVKDISADNKDKKQLRASIAGKQKEPNRGEGASRKPSVPRAHVTRPGMNEKAEITRHHPTHKLISSTGNEIKYGSSVKNASDVHIIDKIEPGKFGNAGDRVITHSASHPELQGSFHPKDIGTKIIKRSIKEARDSEFNANKELTPKKKKSTQAEYDNAYHNWVHSSDRKEREAKKKLDAHRKSFMEDIGMGAGAAGDPGAVRDPNSNYAAQKARGVKVKSLMRRKKPVTEKYQRETLCGNKATKRVWDNDHRVVCAHCGHDMGKKFTTHQAAATVAITHSGTICKACGVT